MCASHGHRAYQRTYDWNGSMLLIPVYIHLDVSREKGVSAELPYSYYIPQKYK